MTDLADMDTEFDKPRIIRPDRLLPAEHKTTIKIIHNPFVMEDEESGWVGLAQRSVDGHLGALEE